MGTDRDSGRLFWGEFGVFEALRCRGRNRFLEGIWDFPGHRPRDPHRALGCLFGGRFGVFGALLWGSRSKIWGGFGVFGAAVPCERPQPQGAAVRFRVSRGFGVFGVKDQGQSFGVFVCGDLGSSGLQPQGHTQRFEGFV